MKTFAAFSITTVSEWISFLHYYLNWLISLEFLFVCLIIISMWFFISFQWTLRLIYFVIRLPWYYFSTTKTTFVIFSALFPLYDQSRKDDDNKESIHDDQNARIESKTLQRNEMRPSSCNISDCSCHSCSEYPLSSLSHSISQLLFHFIFCK